MRFNFFSIKIYLSYPAVALIGISLFSGYSGNSLLIFCLISTIIHEFGHLIFICRYMGKPDSIIINPGEVRINSDLSEVTYFQDIYITSAGVIFNFITAVFSMVLFNIFKVQFIMNFALCNLCLGIINLLPVRSFDGGQLLSSLLLCKLSERTTDVIINTLTIITFIPLATAGIYILFVTKYNYSLLIIAIYTITLIISKETR